MFGIITYHDGYNFGTYLQVYSMQEVIKGLGYKCCIVNYKSLGFFLKEYRALLYTKRPGVLLGGIGKALKFTREHKRLELTSRYMNPENIDNLGLSGIVYGSDEIWNYENPAIGGFDSVYFGGHFSCGKKISYAPSFGTLSLDRDVLPEVKSYLCEFEHLSVRDVHSQMIAEKITGSRPPIVLDPTLLYDLRGQESKCPREKFILVYTTGFSSEVQDELIRFARKKRLKLVSVGYRQAFCDINDIALGPFDYLGYISQADYVVTSMFHGVMLSLVYNKRMAVVVDSYRTNKLSTVMETFRVRDRVFNTGKLEQILEQEVDVEGINHALSVGRQLSMDYLKAALA